MKRNNVSLAIFIATSALAHAGNDTLHYNCSLFYAHDDYRLNETQQKQVRAFLKKKDDVFAFSIEIKGYADVNGTDNYNEILSKKRAHEVYNFIQQNGIPAKSISELYFGERFSKSDSNLASYKQYRRVDISLSIAPYNKENWLQTLSPTTSQQTSFRSDSTYAFKGKWGSIIEVPSNAFVDKNGQPYNGTVSLELKEAVDALGIVSLGLATSSDGLPLITRGMIYIEAKGHNNQELSLAEEKTLNITLPSTKNTSIDMNVFYGEQQADGSVNWKIDSSTFAKKVRSVPINISKKKLAALNISIPNVCFPKYNAELVMPRVPTKPHIPRKPQVPDSSRYKYTASAIEKTFWSKEKMKRKNAEVYARVYKQYIARLKRYEERLAELPAKQAQYNNLYAQYQQDSIAYEQQILERVHSLIASFDVLKEKNVARHLASLQKQIIATPITSTTQLKNLLYRYRPVEIDEVGIMKKALGKEAFNHFFSQRVKKNNAFCLKDTENPAREYIGYRNTPYKLLDSLAKTSGMKEALDNMQSEWLDSMAALGLLTTKEFDGYVANVSNLGWINCDRFYNVPSTQKAIAQVNETDDATIYLIMKNQAVFLKLNKTAEAQYVSSNGVPKNEEYKILAVKIIDNKPMVAVSELNHLPKEPIKLVYTPGSAERIKNELRNITTL